MGRHNDLRNIAPCFYCRRPMNWIASDPNCLAVCRRCLAYLASVSGRYSSLLTGLALQAAFARGEIKCSWPQHQQRQAS